MIFHHFFYSCLSINSYLIGDEETKTCVVVDPTRQIDEYIKTAEELGLVITDILETHVHADYICGSPALKSALKGKPIIHCSAMGGKEWIPAYADVQVKEGDEIVLGSVHLKAMHTPGHSPEHLIWIGYDGLTSPTTPCFILTGDFLLIGGIGRPDILEKTSFQNHAEAQYQSLFQKLSSLPDFLMVFPGHGYGSACGDARSPRTWSTLGYEKQTSSLLKPQPFETWSVEMERNMPPMPPTFKRNKSLNLKGAAANTLIFPKEMQTVEPGVLLIDIRDPEAFAAGHQKNTINIGWSTSFCHWASWLVPLDTPFVIIYDDEAALKEAVIALQLIGADQIAGKMKYRPNKEDTSFPMVTAEDLYEQWKNRTHLVVDVRSDEEWNSGHIADALHIKLEKLNESMNKIPKDAPLTVVCHKGHRASTGASLLQKAGFENVRNLQGGMLAWTEKNYPFDISKK